MPSIPFRFDAESHEYIDAITGVVYPHITLLLERAGLVDDTWFSEESTVRGKAVHRLTADFDLGSIERPAEVVSRYKGYLLAHVDAMQILRPTIREVELPMVHPALRFGGRPDREIELERLFGVFEIKSGVYSKSHQIQTALQCILVSAKVSIPAESLGRWCAYYKANGRFKIERHDNRNDFAEARRILKVHGGPVLNSISGRSDECPF